MSMSVVTRLIFILVFLNSPGLADFEEDLSDPPQKVIQSESESKNSEKPDPLKKNTDVPKRFEKPKQKPKKRSSNTKRQDDRKLPVYLKSHGAKGFRDSGKVELVKDVVVTQGNFELKSEMATIYYDADTEEVDRVEAKGSVESTRKDPETGIVMKARADTMTFYNQKRIVVLRGNARLWRGKDLLRGKEITYNLETGWAEAVNVEGVMTPGENSSGKK